MERILHGFGGLKLPSGNDIYKITRLYHPIAKTSVTSTLGLDKLHGARPKSAI